MLYLVILLVLIIAGGVVFYFNEKGRRYIIRIGKRGSSVMCGEMDYNNDRDTIKQIVHHLCSINEYRIYFVQPEKADGDMKSDLPLSEKPYTCSESNNEEVSTLLDKDISNFSIFLMNEEVENKAKVILTHDLIINSAQIPDRELLLESGFIITVIDSSNLLVLTGVRGSFERALVFIFEKLFEKSRDIVVRKM